MSAEINKARLLVRALLMQATEIDRQLSAAVQEAWPVGSSICWIRTGRHPAFGRVLTTAYGRIKVLNADSGKEVWITPDHIARASEPQDAAV